MKVSQLVPVEQICIGWPTSNIPGTKSKWEFIQSMVGFLCEAHKIKAEHCQAVINQVIEREKSMTTAIGHGIAIPHASIPRLSKPTGLLVILPGGIEFEAIDHELVRIAILVLLPEKDYKKHIQTLSNIVDLTSFPGLQEKLLQANTPGEIWKIIAEIENTPKVK